MMAVNSGNPSGQTAVYFSGTMGFFACGGGLSANTPFSPYNAFKMCKDYD